MIAQAAMFAPPGINYKAIIYRTGKWRKSYASQEISRKVTPGFPLTENGRLLRSRQILKCHSYAASGSRRGTVGFARMGSLAIVVAIIMMIIRDIGRINVGFRNRIVIRSWR